MADSEYFNFGETAIWSLSEKIDPSDNTFSFVIDSDEFLKFRVGKVVSELLNDAIFDEPQISFVGIARVQYMFWSEDDSLDDMSQYSECFVCEVSDGGALHEYVYVAFLHEGGFEGRGEVFGDFFLFVSVVHFFDDVLVEVMRSYFVFEFVGDGEDVHTAVEGTSLLLVLLLGFGLDFDEGTHEVDEVAETHAADYLYDGNDESFEVV